MASGGSISGVGVAAMTAGGFLVYIGIQNVGVLAGLRQALKGQQPTAGPQSSNATSLLATAATGTGTTGTGPGATATAAGMTTNQTALNSAILADVQKYIGIPYVYAGSTPQSGFDCSGLVHWVLANDLGLAGVPRTTQTFMIWTGATTVGNPQPGDLVCWSGHMGIMSRPGYMIDALKTGTKVREDAIWSVPTPVYRRVNANG